METTQTSGTLSPRNQRFKDRVLSSSHEVDIERARYYTRSWKKGDGQGPGVRAAKAQAEVLRNLTIAIHEDEQLVGVKSSKFVAEPLAVERGSMNDTVNLLLDPRIGRQLEQGDFNLAVGGLSSRRAKELVNSVTPEERKEWLEELLPFWNGKTARDMKLASWKKEGLFNKAKPSGLGGVGRILKSMGGLRNGLKFLGGGALGKMSLGTLALLPLLPKVIKMGQGVLPDSTFLILDMQGHVIPGYKRVLEIGFKGIAEWAKKELAELEPKDEDYELKKDFYQSAEIVAKGVCDYSNRFAALARQMAGKASGERKDELLAIAERCDRVPAEPPRTFMEALQAIWLTIQALSLSYGGDNIFSPGRLDQYLYPYYRADLEAGRITRDQALEALEELSIKVSTHLFLSGANNFTIGGIEKNGESAVNEVSYLLLEAFENINGMGNGLSVRISPHGPREFLVRASVVHRKTAGIAFYNDEVVIRDLTADGYSLEDARDYSIVGCVEPTSTGNNCSYTAGNAVFMVGVLEMALNEGRRLFQGDRLIGVRTPDPATFTSFDDVKKAFADQLAFAVDKCVKATELKDRVFSDKFPTPLLSSTLEGCLESGKDMTRGGAKYNNGHVNSQGLATVTNSLAAVKWAVFDEKIVTMKELMEALRSNYKDHEKLRRQLLSKAPKFGNDDPLADEIAEWVSEVFTNEVRKHKCWRGGNYRPSMLSSGTQDLEGQLCGATSDGRLAGEVVSNGISPANGTEKNGMTAAFQSVVRAGKTIYSDGTSLNMNLSPGLLKTEEGINKFADMLEAYFEMGGRHVQFNPLDPETLKDAQAHPEKYPDLTVKVTGYSARFVDLSKTLQDDIVARTEFCEM